MSGKEYTYPKHNEHPAYQQRGLTKREHYALTILHGLVSNSCNDNDLEVDIENAVSTADALIKELEKPAYRREL